MASWDLRAPGDKGWLKKTHGPWSHKTRSPWRIHETKWIIEKHVEENRAFTARAWLHSKSKTKTFLQFQAHHPDQSARSTWICVWAFQTCPQKMDHEKSKTSLPFVWWYNWSVWSSVTVPSRFFHLQRPMCITFIREEGYSLCLENDFGAVCRVHAECSYITTERKKMYEMESLFNPARYVVQIAKERPSPYQTGIIMLKWINDQLMLTDLMKSALQNAENVSGMRSHSLYEVELSTMVEK